MSLCRKVQELIPLYILRDCDNDEASKVREHLQGCNVCREYFQYVTQLYRSFEATEEVSVPEIGPEIVYNVNMRIDRFQRKRRVIAATIPSFALVFIALVVSIFLIQNVGDRASSSVSNMEFMQSVGLLGEVTDEAIYEALTNTSSVISDDLANTVDLKKEYLLYEFQNFPEIDISTILSIMSEDEFENFVGVLYASSL
ncbi:MAG: hypothetical protein DRP92_04770 [Candidatus Neomarinimicrobiota bacterium]|nr:zf-HC2 domain-containing protein [Candidatus Neomarinimicrobiota bacterium]RKY52847.1 MAG: hypothetical protein DRP92_04770 [Candidatus Neomarinimicrobiota bacterium]